MPQIRKLEFITQCILQPAQEQSLQYLTPHICVGNLTIIGSDNGLSPGQCQAIFLTNAEILSIGPVVTNFSELLIVIHTFSFKKIHLKLSSAKGQPFCLGLNVLKNKVMSTGVAEHFMLTICRSILQIPWSLINLLRVYEVWEKLHCRDKTVVRLCYLHNGISFTGKIAFYTEMIPWIVGCGLWETFPVRFREYGQLTKCLSQKDVTFSFTPQRAFQTSKHRFISCVERVSINSTCQLF